MDHSRFDEIAKVLAAPSRRSLLGVAGAAALAALLGWDGADARKKKKKKKKKPKPCTENCVGKVCGESNGCGGACSACPQGKTCVTNQCVDDVCEPQCSGKDCGDDDGCGIKCTTQQGCGANQTCVNGECVAGTCNPSCTGGQRCCHVPVFDIFACRDCCDDSDCPHDDLAESQGRTICNGVTCECPAATPKVCRVFGSEPLSSHCTNPLTDKTNCSPFVEDCGFACSPPDDPDWECCNGTCAFVRGCLTNTNTSDCQRTHCGACGQPCEGAGVACCEGVCVNSREEGNCGFCGLTCADEGMQCCSGVCKFAC